MIGDTTLDALAADPAFDPADYRKPGWADPKPGKGSYCQVVGCGVRYAVRPHRDRYAPFICGYCRSKVRTLRQSRPPEARDAGPSSDAA